MEKLIIKLLVLLAISGLFGQEQYRSIEQVQAEWNDHTSFQRDELLSFCDFLFEEKLFERCLLTCFQFLYRFPDDPMRPVLLYTIGRSYEEMENYSLAQRYYRRIMDTEPEHSVTFRAAEYRDIYSDLMKGQTKGVMTKTEGSDDPYFLTFRGYSYLRELKWEEARTIFILAEEKFDHRHYSKLMVPLYQAIENVETIPQHDRAMVALTGTIFPGGGQFMLKEWKKGQGVLVTALVLSSIIAMGQINEIEGSAYVANSPGLLIPYYRDITESGPSNFILSKGRLTKPVSPKTSVLQYTLPPIVLGLGVYMSSVWRSFIDIKDKNRALIEFYVLESIDSIEPDRFLDFDEPALLYTSEK